VECYDHFQLAPVPAVRIFYGYGKIKAGEATMETGDGKIEPIWDHLDPNEEIWAVVQLFKYEDGHEEQGDICYLRQPRTEKEVQEAVQDMIDRNNVSREELLNLTRVFDAGEEVYQEIDETCPNYQFPPSDPNSTDEHDVYEARLKVMSKLQPKTVELIRIADATKDPVEREKVEREAVQSFFAELPHYLSEDEVLAWERSNPVGSKWMSEFVDVKRARRRTIDPIDHELALNWPKYNQLTAKALSHSILKKLRIRLTPGAAKKRRERLGLTSKRPPGH
jgi:hypothetical protein